MQSIPLKGMRTGAAPRDYICRELHSGDQVGLFLDLSRQVLDGCSPASIPIPPLYSMKGAPKFAPVGILVGNENVLHFQSEVKFQSI